MAGDDRGQTPPRVAIVSTSINRNPTAYAQWALQGDLIVAGDVNSPDELNDYVTEIGGEYLTPDEQKFFSFSAAIPWSSIQRRNVAVMVAYARQYDYIATVDDDNYPTPDWVSQHIGNVRGDVSPTTMLVRGDRGWTNPGRFVHPITNQRGVPLGAARQHTLLGVTRSVAESVVVSQAQIIGDPDCDAVTRLVHQPRVQSAPDNIIVDVNDWTAFNSQATMWDGRWAPLIACLPHVGRYDDIFASFIAKLIMRHYGKTVYVGSPTVVQNRNVHNIISDLKNEYYGIEATPYVISALEDAYLPGEFDLAAAYHACTDALQRRNAIHPDALHFMEMWYESWRKYQW